WDSSCCSVWAKQEAATARKVLTPVGERRHTEAGRGKVPRFVACRGIARSRRHESCTMQTLPSRGCTVRRWTGNVSRYHGWAGSVTVTVSGHATRSRGVSSEAGYESVPERQAPGVVGGDVSGQLPERRQTVTRHRPQGQPLVAATLTGGCSCG